MIFVIGALSLNLMVWELTIDQWQESTLCIKTCTDYVKHSALNYIFNHETILNACYTNLYDKSRWKFTI